MNRTEQISYINHTELKEYKHGGVYPIRTIDVFLYLLTVIAIVLILFIIKNDD